MKVPQRFLTLRKWVPLPTSGVRPKVIRWVLLEGNRLAVTFLLLAFVFSTIVGIGLLWTIEMQVILTETATVQTILNTFMSGIILLVSIVVSINAIALSHDITSIETQEARVEGAMEFRQEIGTRTPVDWQPSRPASFLEAMANVLRDRVEKIGESVDGMDGGLAEDTNEFVSTVHSDLERFDDTSSEGVDFGVLWSGLEVDYGRYVDSVHKLKDKHGEEMSPEYEQRLDDLIHELELFEIGREYFKTLFYNREVSTLSRTLLVISLPAILFTASAILTVQAGILLDLRRD